MVVVRIVPVEKAMTKELVGTIASLAPDKLNLDYVTERLISVSGEDPDKWLKEPIQAPTPDQLAQTTLGNTLQGRIGRQMTQGIDQAAQGQRPTLNTLASQQ